MERRAFLLSLPLLIAASTDRGRALTLGIARASGAAGSPADRGIQFGLHEAEHTLALLGRELQWLERTGPEAAAELTAAGAELIVALGSPRQPSSAVPVLHVPLAESETEPCGVHDWQVAPAPGQRRAALAEYRDSHPAAPPSLRALAWAPVLERYGAQQLNERFAAFADAPMTEDAWLGWIAVRIALESALRGAPATQLSSPRFAIDGHKGAALRFDAASRRLQQPLYIIDPQQPTAPPLAEITPATGAGICTIEGAISA